MTTTDARSHLSGSLRAENGRGTVRMEDVHDTTAADLWSALTEPARLARWIAEVSGDLVVGGSFQARFTSSWEGPGRVDVCEPGRHLVVTMAPGSDEETVIEATLTPGGRGTRLVIEERGLPLAEVAAHGAGWQAHVEDLAAHLTGRDPAPWIDRWTQLNPTYRELADGLAGVSPG